MKNMDIETYVEISNFRETSKVSSLDPCITTRSDQTENKLYISEKPVEFPAEHVSDQSKINAAPKGRESRQFRTKSLNCYDSYRSHDRRNLKDRAATHSSTCQGLSKNKLTTLTTNFFMQFMNEMKVYILRNKVLQKNKKQMCTYYKNKPPNPESYLEQKCSRYF